jgi:hypothetical protein
MNLLGGNVFQTRWGKNNHQGQDEIYGEDDAGSGEESDYELLGEWTEESIPVVQQTIL